MPAAKLRRTVRVLAAMLAAALVGCVAPAPAQTSDPEALGSALAHELLTTGNAKAYLVSELATREFAEAHALELGPGWQMRLREAATEEVDENLPLLERRAGHVLALTFTTQELQAINAFLRKPGGRALLAYVAGVAAGQAPPAPSGEVRADVERFLATPEGAAFRTKVEDMDDLLEQLQSETADDLAPGVARRFREKSDGAGG